MRYQGLYNWIRRGKGDVKREICREVGMGRVLKAAPKELKLNMVESEKPVLRLRVWSVDQNQAKKIILEVVFCVDRSGSIRGDKEAKTVEEEFE